MGRGVGGVRRRDPSDRRRARRHGGRRLAGRGDRAVAAARPRRHQPASAATGGSHSAAR
ncbi:50S ribosomal protein L34 [Rhodopseudomonas palustris]|nr:50S ribosomal protein L34 [Rhodopseudomonas palustris]RHZ94443.1 50S ribosomal protein L34 [Rhodopseudomonas palustris]